MDEIWDRIGYFPLFFYSKEDPIVGRAQHAYAVAEDNPLSNRPPRRAYLRSATICPIQPCDVCSNIHSALPWKDAIMIGCGYFDATQTANLKSNDERSHLCGISWYHNSKHLLAEMDNKNVSR